MDLRRKARIAQQRMIRIERRPEWEDGEEECEPCCIPSAHLHMRQHSPIATQKYIATSKRAKISLEQNELRN